MLLVVSACGDDGQDSGLATGLTADTTADTTADSEMVMDDDELADMAMADEPNAFMIEPGETKELTWHFTEGGEVLIGCHVPGHYAAGMKAEISVEA